MLDPWSVFLHGVTTFVGSLLTIDDGGSPTRLVLEQGTWPVDSVEIIPIKIAGELLISCGKSIALWSHLLWKNIVEGVEAAFVIPLFPEFLWNDIEVGSSGSEGWMDIVKPVSCAISDHKTFERDLQLLWPELSLEIVFVDLPGEIGNVDTGVTLSRNEELVGLKLRELIIEGVESSEGVL